MKVDDARTAPPRHDPLDCEEIDHEHPCTHRCRMWIAAAEPSAQRRNRSIGQVATDAIHAQARHDSSVAAAKGDIQALYSRDGERFARLSDRRQRRNRPIAAIRPVMRRTPALLNAACT
jgi:hypothetical protein